MTLESAEPKGKRLRWQMLKPRLGLAGGVLFKANCLGVPITPNHVRNAKIKEHNTGMTETRAARVEQKPGKRPSLPPNTKYRCALIKQDIM